MALSAPSTPRPVYATPKRRALVNNAQTPECFSKVTLETPQSAMKRRSSREKFDQECNLKVAVRVRPMNAKELMHVGVTNVVKVKGQELIMRSNLIGAQNSLDHIFQYDHVFWSCDEEDKNYASQEDVFDAMGSPLLDYAFRGYNACLFAYGQTGSGKSYSMMGLNAANICTIDPHTGIIPRFCEELFNRIAQLENCSASVEVSYFEIYNEKIHDLLLVSTNNQRMPLKVREHPVWGPYVVDLSVHTVTSYKELKHWLLLGNNNRATAATAMNEKSSRSHSIFSIEISLADSEGDADTSRRSKISLVDLAGSERLQGNIANDERMKQGVCINKSLLTLGKVISALADQQNRGTFVPYRDSVLTWLLRESLGGNSLTSMLATITPASSNVDETLATLRYACQARSIVNRARVNESPHDKLIRELRAEVERLKALRQDYERNSIGSIINISDSMEQEQELDDLRLKLVAAEEKLHQEQNNWQLRFMESRQQQLKELAEAEKRKEELESHLRVMKISDTDVDLSPYRTNFLEELEGMLENEKNIEETENKKPNKTGLSTNMKQIFESMNNLRPAVDEMDDNIKLLYARINKLLQKFETALKNSANTKKTVTFKL